jgi:hypothetical protein
MDAVDNQTAKANAGYKASVFSLLFENPPTLRELYYALTGRQVPPDTPIAINTLRDALYKARINDISFTIGDKLVILIEHQSTINPNMALRLLLYIARLYEKLVDNKALYKRTPIKIARPEFIVLYNGIDPCPETRILRLSDMYEVDPADIGINLELEVKLFNINSGFNTEMLDKCAALDGYIRFVAKEREFEADGSDRDAAIKRAVHYCVKHNILKDFLLEHGSEVTNMLLDEWDWDVALEVSFEEGMEIGKQEGLEIGERRGMEIGKQEGLEIGKEQERTFFLDLLRQGCSLEQIERTLATRSSAGGVTG